MSDHQLFAVAPPGFEEVVAQEGVADHRQDHLQDQGPVAQTTARVSEQDQP